MAEKRYLMTPGPTPVPPEVLAAMAQPIIHHRGPDFRAIYKRTLERLQELGDVKVVFLTQSETSTGVVADIASLATAAKAAGALVAVDAISSLGAVPLETDTWGIDAVASGSQKALMTPPGLAMVSVSDQAWSSLARSPRFYFDWEKTRKAQAKLDAAFTPAV